MRPKPFPLTPRMEEAVQKLKGMITTPFRRRPSSSRRALIRRDSLIKTVGKDRAKFPPTPFSLTHSEGR